MKSVSKQTINYKRQLSLIGFEIREENINGLISRTERATVMRSTPQDENEGKNEFFTRDYEGFQVLRKKPKKSRILCTNKNHDKTQN